MKIYLRIVFCASLVSAIAGKTDQDPTRIDRLMYKATVPACPRALTQAMYIKKKEAACPGSALSENKKSIGRKTPTNQQRNVYSVSEYIM